MTDLLPKNLANSPERLEVDVSPPKPEVKVDVDFEEPGKVDDENEEEEDT